MLVDRFLRVEYVFFLRTIGLFGDFGVMVQYFLQYDHFITADFSSLLLLPLWLCAAADGKWGKYMDTETYFN